MKQNKLHGMIGLARKANKTVCGTPLVCLALRKETKPFLVTVSAHASEGTRNKLRYKCEFYKVPYILIDCPTAELSHIVGKTGEIAAVAITDENFAKAILSAAELTGKDGTAVAAPKQ